MTSAGQSADVQMLYAVAQKSGLEAEVRAVAEADQLDADAYKTLIIAVGGSSKGLGAAGIDADEEKVRVQKIIDKFKDSTTIIVAHIGGEARRGELSPTDLSKRCCLMRSISWWSKAEITTVCSRRRLRAMAFRWMSARAFPRLAARC